MKNPFSLGKIDGVLSLGDILAALFAMIAIMISLGITGAGLELLYVVIFSAVSYSFIGLVIGLSFGMIMGGLVATVRISADLLHGSEPTPIVPEYDFDEGDDLEDLEPPLQSFGIKIEAHGNNQVRRSTLLEEMDRIKAIGIMRSVAFQLIRRGEAFSKRRAAKLIPEQYRTEVRDELVRLGFLVKESKAPNSGYGLTGPGEAFFNLFLNGADVPDPIIIKYH